MKDTICKTAFAVSFFAALSVTAMAGEVTTRVFGEATAASGSTVVTRPIGERSEPSVGVTPLALSLLPNLEAPGERWSVYGLRVNLIAGRHRNVAGFDIGGLGNITVEDFDGVQAAGLWNRIGRTDGAVQVAGILNHCDRDFTGVQIAAIANVAEGTCEGVQVGLFNRASDLSGFQLGLYNVIDRGSGVQVGFVNAARTLDGLQIGVVNVIRQSTFPFCPVLNFAF